MKHIRLKKIVCVLLSLFMIVSLFSHVLADAGNVNRYDGGGSSSDYSSSDKKSSSSGTLSEKLVSFGITFGAIVVLYYTVYLFRRPILKAMKKSAKRRKMPWINLTQEITQKIRMNDPEFSSEDFLKWTEELYIKLQEAWTKRDWNIIRPFESNTLFEQHKTQLQEYITKNRINIIDNIQVVDAQICAYKQQGNKEILVVNLEAYITDYIINAKTRKVVESDEETRWHMKYRLTFERKLGVKTKRGLSNKSTTNCPNCGAPLKIGETGKCDYCGSVITTGEYDFVLTNLVGEK